MKTWKLIGVGLLISVLVRGCPNTAEQSTSVSDTQPLQSPNTQKESSLSSKPPSSLLKLPSIPPVSPLPPKGTQDSSSTPIARNLSADSEKAQSTSSQISVLPSVSGAISSRVVQQDLEPDFNVPRVQDNVPVDGESRQNIINQRPDQSVEASVLDLPNIETEQRSLVENVPESPSENSLNSALRRDTTASTDEENVAPQNQPLSSPVISSSSESGSGKCNYPWELDSAGNRCGDRAASERPNLSTGNAVGKYSAPIRSYSIPTSSYGSTYVRGYFRKNGTYVRGHSRRRR
jgi:hypothetical protein